MSDLRDFTGKNRKFTGTSGERISLGTTGNRVNTQGILRFNTSTNLMEYYNGNDWKAIDAPPVITSFSVDSPAQTNVTSGYITSGQAGNVVITVNGSLFDTTGANVTLVGSGETLSPDTLVRNSSNLLTATYTASNLDISNDPYTLKVTNGSGLSAELVDAITVDQAPVFTNAADTNYSILDSLRGSGTIAAGDLAGATDADGDTITYSVSVGSLPSGVTLNTSTGAFTWSSVSAVASDAVSTFSITATTSQATSTRQFTITVKAPIVTQFTSTGPGTFAVPSGITSIDVLVLAGGGGGGSGTAGAGGAGGYIDRPGLPVTPGSTISYNVGAGNPRPTGSDIGQGNNGSNSVFGTLTAIGGGGGGSSHPGQPQGGGEPGGSGGGGSSYPTGNFGGGSGTQPGQPGESGNYGYGNSGVTGPSGGAGGGAGGAGSGHIGGPGRASSITGTSVTRGGGGRGQGNNPSPGGGAPGGGGGNQGSYGQDAPANQGGGGGAGWDYGGGRGGAGGPGIIIVKY